MPGDERLGEPDVVGELGDGGVTADQPPDDSEAVHVGHGLVEDAQLAQVFGWRDGCGDRAADSGA